MSAMVCDNVMHELEEQDELSEMMAHERASAALRVPLTAAAIQELNVIAEAKSGILTMKWIYRLAASRDFRRAERTKARQAKVSWPDRVWEASRTDKIMIIVRDNATGKFSNFKMVRTDGAWSRWRTRPGFPPMDPS